MPEQSTFFSLILKHGRKLRLERGEYLYNEGDASRYIYAIESGLVGLYKVTSEGKEILLRVFGKGYFLGHRSFITGEEHHATAVVLSKSNIYQISTSSFSSLLENSQYARLVLRVLGKELRHCENRFAKMQEKDTLFRVAEALIFLKCRDPKYQWTRKEIADFCGLTMESVIRALSKLERDRFLKKEGRLLELSLSPENLCRYGISRLQEMSLLN